MVYVYMLMSIADPDQRYTGFTADHKQRVDSHNQGASVHTRRYRPWKLVNYFAFDDERRVREFEYYLKSRSGAGLRQQAFFGRPRLSYARGARVGCPP